MPDYEPEIGSHRLWPAQRLFLSPTRDSAGPLLEALRDARSLLYCSPADWNLLIPQARAARLLGRLCILADEGGFLDRLPEKAQDHLQAARAIAGKNARMVRWEVNRLQRALQDWSGRLVLLKGAAYVLADLPPARGRLAVDVDIFVAKTALAAVERALTAHGWSFAKLDVYDEHYYRTWMHELPPLRHRERLTSVDVHHSILPPTGRLHPDPALLLAAARTVDESGTKVLAPADMVAHSAAHLFQDGEVSGGLRDLVDLDDLLRHFSATPGFWEELSVRAGTLDLGRPVYYALRYSNALLGTPVPSDVFSRIAPYAPPRPFRAAMDYLVTTVLTPEDPWKDRAAAARLAAWLLYVRSHWLRMPARLLVPHLVRKAIKRRTAR